MKRSLCLLALGAGVVLPASAQAAPAPADATAACEAMVAPSGRVKNFNAGGLGARECALVLIREGRDASLTPTNFSGTLDARVATGRDSLAKVNKGAKLLEGFYGRRGGRQQTIMDAGAGVSFVGAMGALLSGGAGAVTQQAWLGAGFLPVIGSEFNANEPTRDLYHAGEIALAWMNTRYERLDSIAAALLAQTSVPNPPGGRLPPLSACTAVDTTIGTVLDMGGDDRSVLLPEARRIAASCRTQRLAAEEMNHTIDVAKGLSTRWSADYAADVLRLDQRLVSKDRDLRYSPAETLGATLASPFRALDTALSGQNPGAAVTAVRTQTALDGLNQKLSPVRLPARPRVLPVVADLSEAAAARANVTRTDQAERLKVNTVVSNLQEAVDALALQQRTYSTRAALIQELHAAAEATDLSFAYDVPTRMVRVTLAAPAPAAPVLVTGTTP